MSEILKNKVSNPEVRYFILIGSLENETSFVGKLSSLGLIKFKRVLFSTKNRKRMVLWSLYLIVFVEASVPSKGSFDYIWNYFEKGSKVAWQEYLKYREYIFAPSEKLLTGKEKS